MVHPNADGFIGERLSLARDARNVTQAHLAAVLGVVTPTISRWEHGDRTPDAAQLAGLAAALGVYPTYFLRPIASHGDAPIFFRSLASATVKARTKERAKMRWLQHISLTLQESLEFPNVNIGNAIQEGDYVRLSDSDLEDIAIYLRRLWGLGDGPIRNISLVLENAGVTIGIDEVGSTKIDGQANWSAADNRPYILLARDKYTAFRRQMDLAHEMSHLVLHKNVSKAQLERDFELVEHQAKYLAGAFMMPERSFTAEIPSLSLDGFLSLKKRWMVAIGAMIMRAEQLGILNEEAARRLWKYRATRGWNRREPLDHPSETPVEEPRFLRRSIELLSTEGIRTKRDLLETDIGLGATDVEILASLEPGYFSEDNAEVVPFEPKLRTSDMTGAPGQIIEFRRTR